MSIWKVLKCDTVGCTEREEFLEGENSVVGIGWFIRNIEDRTILADGGCIGGNAQKNYCPTHGPLLPDLHPRIRQELDKANV
jgi:hypothetical protein